MTARSTESNKTAHDAFLRVLDARTGSMADASDEYLLALAHELLAFHDRVTLELNNRVIVANKKAEGGRS